MGCGGRLIVGCCRWRIDLWDRLDSWPRFRRCKRALRQKKSPPLLMPELLPEIQYHRIVAPANAGAQRLFGDLQIAPSS